MENRFKNIKIIDARANNLKGINIEISFGQLTICVGPSGSGKSSFAFNTLVQKQNCKILNYPKNVCYISQQIFNTSQKLDQILRFKDIKDSLIIIDEPLAGTTRKEALKYSKIIKDMALSNAVVVVEHRRELFEFADKILMFGPESGAKGGYLLNIIEGKEYLRLLPKIEVKREKNNSQKKISAIYSNYNGIDNYKVELKLNSITAVVGPGRSGKSTYLEAVFKAFDKSVNANQHRKNLISIKNKQYIRRPHIIDASPVTKNSRSTVATYYGISQFLKDKNINITINEALELYKEDSLLIRRLEIMEEVGLGYLKLNQSSYSLSGGECQRIKLAKLLCKKLGDRSIYIFDNPVRGLGEENITQIMLMFDRLVKNNNTVLIAENDPIAIKYADNIIEF